MRRPELLAARDAPKQRDGGIGEVIGRQQQRRSRLPVPGELEQAPAEQEADRQAADIAQEHFCDRLVEGRKAEHGAAQRGGNQRCRP
ncbi:hypothetical protein ACVIW2_008686 [Bradyrhizobium huanghuaihaiense]